MRPRLWKIGIGCILLLAGLIFAARPLRARWLLFRANRFLSSAENESNKLYAEHRPFLYRWIGAPYGTSKETDPRNCTAVPEHEINHLQWKIGEAEDVLGATNRLLRLKGRAALLSCNPAESIKNYQSALLRSPGDADLRLELGIAFALNATPANPLEIESALEHVLEAIQIRTDAESLYDSALLFEQAQLFLQARQRWVDTVAAEPVAQWKEDSKQRSKVRQDFFSDPDRQMALLASPASPASYLAASEERQQKDEELALDWATREWLAEIGKSPDAARAVQHLSALLLRDRHDKWLLDLLKTKPSSSIQNAMALLTKAAGLNLKGEHSHAADAAGSSERIFKKSHNLAGALRARLEIAYSLDRQDKADKCLAMLGVKPGNPATAAQPGSLEVEAKQEKYVWIMAQARLEQVGCLTRKRSRDVIALRAAADALVAATGYAGLGLRSLSFLTEPYVAAGSRLVLWQRAQRGLHTFWSTPLPIIRVYSFYYTLGASARNAGDPQAALAILREGTLLMQGSGLNLLRGILLSSLGQWEMEAGLTQQADRTFADMVNEFKQVDPDDIAQVWDEAEVAHAEALVATGRTQEGLALLRERTKGADWPYSSLNANLRRVLLPAFGNAYLRAGNLQDACQYFLQSITETRKQMAKIKSHVQRDDALREIDSSWRGLTAVKLRQKLPREALAVWETFRSGRNSQKRNFIFPGCGPAASPPSFAAPQNATVLVYASLPTMGLSAWMIKGDKVEQKRLDANGIKERVERLSALLSNETSPLEEISSLSVELYQLLLAPLAGSLPPSGTLVVDPEGELAAVPWNVLEEKPGHPLVEKFAIAQVIGFLNLATSAKRTGAGLESALIFGPPVLSKKLAEKYTFPYRAAEEADALQRLLPNSRFFRKEDANFQTLKTYAPEKTLFHFAGHSISNGGFSALLLPQTREGPPEAQNEAQNDAQYYGTAEKIAALDLRQMKTVVLASCSAGAGEKSGTVNLDSLARAFLEAGTHRVVAAGWDVSSAKTEDLMLAFYGELLQGARPAEALRLSQLKVRALNPHPFHWAAFQVFGEP